MSAVEPTHVYMLGYSDGIVKIGRTSNFKQRRRALSAEGHRREADITRQWVRRSGDARRTEWYLRMLGYAHFERPWGTEYFRADYAEFVDVMEKVLTLWGLEDCQPEWADQWSASNGQINPFPLRAGYLQEEEEVA